MFMVRMVSDIGFHYNAITYMIETKSYGVEANIISIFEFGKRLISDRLISFISVVDFLQNLPFKRISYFMKSLLKAFVKILK